MLTYGNIGKGGWEGVSTLRFGSGKVTSKMSCSRGMYTAVTSSPTSHCTAPAVGVVVHDIIAHIPLHSTGCGCGHS